MDTSPKDSFRENTLKFIDGLKKIFVSLILIIFILAIGSFFIIRSEKEKQLEKSYTYINSQLTNIRDSVDGIATFYVSYVEAKQKPSLDQTIANLNTLSKKLEEIDNKITSVAIPEDKAYSSFSQITINPELFKNYNESLFETSKIHISLISDTSCIINGVRDLDQFIEQNQTTLSKSIDNFESTITFATDISLYFNDFSSKANLLFSCYDNGGEILTEEQTTKIRSVLDNIDSISKAYNQLKEALTLQNDILIQGSQSEIANLTSNLQSDSLEDITSTDILIKKYRQKLNEQYKKLSLDYNNLYESYDSICSKLFLQNKLSKVKFELK